MLRDRIWGSVFQKGHVPVVPRDAPIALDTKKNPSMCSSPPFLQAVHTIHEKRIVHSDIKPANFLVVEGQLKLIDFGIAKAIQSGVCRGGGEERGCVWEVQGYTERTRQSSSDTQAAHLERSANTSPARHDLHRPRVASWDAQLHESGGDPGRAEQHQGRPAHEGRWCVWTAGGVLVESVKLTIINGPSLDIPRSPCPPSIHVSPPTPHSFAGGPAVGHLVPGLHPVPDGVRLHAL